MSRIACWGVCVCLVLSVMSGTARAAPGPTGDGAQAAGAAQPDQKKAEGEKAKKAEEEGPPEIEVEVVGTKWGEQAVPSLAPSTGEVLSSVSSEELEATGETALTDALQFLPSFSVVHQGRKFERMVRIRGFAVPTVLLDGALIGLGDFAQRALYTLPVSAVERIDVIRSSSSLIYGPQALTGGVINIITKSGKGPKKVEASVESGGFDYSRTGLAYGEGSDERGTFLAADYDGSGSNLEFGSHRLQHLFFKSSRERKSGEEIKFSILSIDGERSFDVWSEEFMKATGMGPAYWTVNPWRERFFSLAYTRPYRLPEAGFDVLVWYRDRDYFQWNFDGPIAPKPGNTLYTDDNDETIGGSLMWRLSLGTSHLVRFGTQAYQLNGLSQSYVLDAKTRKVRLDFPTSTDTELVSYFAQDEWRLSPGTRVFYGGRFETPQDRDNALVYALGLERDVDPTTLFYARFGTGVVNPTRTQLANDPTLKDQTSDNWDVGLERTFSPRMMGRLGWFQADITNDFIDYLRPGGDPTKTRDYLTAQADRTTSGIELELQGGGGRFGWFANYSHLEQDVTRTPIIGSQAMQVATPPGNSYNVGLRWSPDQRTRLALSYANVGDYLARARYFAGAWPIEAYQLANLTLSRELGKGWRLSAAVDNLLNEEYETQPGFPRPGRNYRVGLAWMTQAD